MALIEGMLSMYSAGFNTTMEGDRSYKDLIGRDADDAPRTYRWTKKQKEFAAKMTEAALALAEDWQQSNSNFGDIAPKPSAELRIRPRV